MDQGGNHPYDVVSFDKAGKLLECLRANGAIAAVFSRPSTHQTLQLKGVDAAVGPLAHGDETEIPLPGLPASRSHWRCRSRSARGCSGCCTPRAPPLPRPREDRPRAFPSQRQPAAETQRRVSCLWRKQLVTWSLTMPTACMWA
jgi:hypothetical protein